MCARGGRRLERRTVPGAKTRVHRWEWGNAGSGCTIRRVCGRRNVERRLVGGERHRGATDEEIHDHGASSAAGRNTYTQWGGFRRGMGRGEGGGAQLRAANGTPGGSGIRPRHALRGDNESTVPAAAKSKEISGGAKGG